MPNSILFQVESVAVKKSIRTRKATARKTSNITPEEWADYIDRDRPIDIRNGFVERNRNLVLKIAWGFVGEAYKDKIGAQTQFFEDITNEGNTGLIKAIEVFNPRRGASFSTFAYKYVHGAIAQYLRDRFYIIRFNQLKCERLKRISKAILSYHYSSGLGRETMPNLLKEKAKLEICFNAIRLELKDKDQIDFNEFYEDFKEYFKARNVSSGSEEVDGFDKFSRIASKTYPSFQEWIAVSAEQVDPRVSLVVAKLISYK